MARGRCDHCHRWAVISYEKALRAYHMYKGEYEGYSEPIDSDNTIIEQLCQQHKERLYPVR